MSYEFEYHNVTADDVERLRLSLAGSCTVLASGETTEVRGAGFHVKAVRDPQTLRLVVSVIDAPGALAVGILKHRLYLALGGERQR